MVCLWVSGRPHYCWLQRLRNQLQGEAAPKPFFVSLLGGAMKDAMPHSIRPSGVLVLPCGGVGWGGVGWGGVGWGG